MREAKMLEARPLSRKSRVGIGAAAVGAAVTVGIDAGPIGRSGRDGCREPGNGGGCLGCDLPGNGGGADDLDGSGTLVGDGPGLEKVSP